MNQTEEQYMHPSHPFSINSISSYLLSCSMYDVPVSLLIDTGAGVSLLKGSVWDRVRPKDHKLRTGTTH